MAKVTGPLLSFRARGQIGKGAVFGSWRGIPYVRQYSVPSNPQTVDQQNVRYCFRYMNDLFRHMGPNALLPWQLLTVGRPLTARNALIKTNLPGLKDEGHLDNQIMSPGAKNGPAPSDAEFVAGGGAGEIDCELIPGELPDGWTIDSAVFTVQFDQNPHGEFIGPLVEHVVATPGPYEYTFTALESAVPYLASGWFVYTRPTGDKAVSVSASMMVTPT